MYAEINRRAALRGVDVLTGYRKSTNDQSSSDQELLTHLLTDLFLLQTQDRRFKNPDRIDLMASVANAWTIASTELDKERSCA